MKNTIPPTDNEMKLIDEKLLNEFPNFYLFLSVLKNTNIRPKELLSIKLKMVDLERNEIILSSEITKTNDSIVEPINPFLKAQFEKIELSNYDQDFFLFGSKEKEVNFVPSEKKISIDYVTKMWQKIIKEDLGINATMYSLRKLNIK